MGQIRIIGGQWRGRQISVIEKEGLRPTPNRVRETLFNWLAHKIVNARCLDLFAGTGALGFEALSRGAQFVMFVEESPEVVKSLKNTAEKLSAQNCRIVQADALKWLTNQADQYDIIFLDPPFHSALLEKCIALLPPLLKPDGLIYIESPTVFSDPHFHILKQNQAGDVVYQLIQKGAG